MCWVKLDIYEQVIIYFGSDKSVEKGWRLYNLLLVYALGGSLAHWVKKNGGCLRESDVRCYTR